MTDEHSTLVIRALRDGTFTVGSGEKFVTVDQVDVDDYTLEKLGQQITTRIGTALDGD